MEQRNCQCRLLELLLDSRRIGDASYDSSGHGLMPTLYGPVLILWRHFFRCSDERTVIKRL